jgi:thymidylate synthase (FAD)
VRIVKPSVELIWITPDAELHIEQAGRTCYKSEDRITPDSARLFVEKIRGMGHLSVLEHASASLRFVCDRGVTHEMVRHRIASYSQESTRYCNYGREKFGREISVVEPPFASDAQREAWIRAMEAAERAYLDMLDAGASPQIARSVLPNALKTEIVMTTNFRSWLHFFELRCAPEAHPQIREVADMARAILAREAPAIFGNAE